MTDTKTRSILKAVSWRVSGTLTTACLVWLLTDQWTTAVAVGGFEAVGKIVIYFFHERLWERIRFGRYRKKPAVLWLTGASTDRKTDLAKSLCHQLKTKGVRFEYIDESNIEKLMPGLGLEQIGHLARLLERQGVSSIISLDRQDTEAKETVRTLCTHFIEVHTHPIPYVSTTSNPAPRLGLISKLGRMNDPNEVTRAPVLNATADRVMNRLEQIWATKG